MTNPQSPIIDFYPLDFRTDLNGKRAEWEALVLIPFIDQVISLSCNKACINTFLYEETFTRRDGSS